jgi:predicted Kef-type K+ transport protein
MSLTQITSLMSMHTVFGEFASLLVLVAVLGALALALRQPLIVAFIAAGILAGPAALDVARSPEHMQLESAYVAVALTFSSTIIIVKLLSDKRELDSLHGRIALGFLIVQDVVVVIAMLALSALGIGSAAGQETSSGAIIVPTIRALPSCNRSAPRVFRASSPVT